VHSDVDHEEDEMSERSLIDGFLESDFASLSDSNDNDNISVNSENTMDIDPWEEIVQEAFDQCQSQYQNEVNEAMEEDTDISESEAKKQVFEDMKNPHRNAIMKTFGSKLVWFDVMKKNPIYKAIKKTISHLIDTEDYEDNEALKYAILKRRFLFDKVLESYNYPQ
jgi:predicted RNA-binding protein Jag